MKQFFAVLLFAVALCACSQKKGPPSFRLGFFPNLTHGQALVGNDEGIFQRALGDTPLTTSKFNAGPAAMEALLAGALDVTYVGSGPALIAYVRSNGAVKIIAGSASGGAMLVSRSAKKAEDLVGRRVASPQIGNSQDISLRYWLMSHGLRPRDLGGTVDVLPQRNSDILSLFRRGEIEAAWVPEPWGSQLLESGGHILVDERTLWKDGHFPTTVLLASRKALIEKREQVKAILRAHLALTARAQANPARFAAEVNVAFGKLTGKRLPMAVVTASFSRLEFLTDPLPEQLQTMVKHASALGYVPESNVAGLVDFQLLRELEAERTAGVPAGLH
jgi:NitT/TauT family transport system substrate-binding protein